MTELCLSSPPKTARVSSLHPSDLLLLLLSSILSHPIYFFYFIFFSPYLLKLLSFLSPLFVTTSLLLLGFLSLSPGLLHDHYPLEPEEPNKFHLFEELEAFQIAFELRWDEAPVLNSASTDETSSSNLALGADFEEKTVEIAWEEKTLEGLLKELDEFEKMDYSVEEKKLVDAPDGVEFDKDKAADEEIAAPTRGSEAKVDKVTGHGTVKVGRDKDREREKPSKPAAPISRTFDQHADEVDDGTGSELFESPRWGLMDSNLGSYGSMRRDKEWKKTLACKLFEERQNVDGGEGMDLLWETYEVDSSSNKANGGKCNNAQKKKRRSKKKSQAELYNDDDDEAEDMDGQLCCLQALKFSTGKMNLGRPNLLKISKAFKGIGWLHNVTRHTKKALHN